MKGWLARLLTPKAPPIAPQPAVKACCLVAENRELLTQSQVAQPNGRLIPIEVRRCKVCGCKHHRLYAGERFEPGRVGIG